MRKRDLFWSAFGKCMACAWPMAIAIGLIEWASPVDVAQFPWAKPFDLEEFAKLFYVCGSMATLCGVMAGIAAVLDYAQRADRHFVITRLP